MGLSHRFTFPFPSKTNKITSHQRNSKKGFVCTHFSLTTLHSSPSLSLSSNRGFYFRFLHPKTSSSHDVIRLRLSFLFPRNRPRPSEISQWPEIMVDIGKHDPLTDGFVHFQQLKFWQNTSTQYIIIDINIPFSDHLTGRWWITKVVITSRFLGLVVSLPRLKRYPPLVSPW